jgi:hypothetical protein
MSYDNERIGTTLNTRLQTNIGAALDTVEATWTARGDPVTLPEPVTWFDGHKPTVLEMVSAEFPFVAVIVGSRSPRSDPIRWGYQVCRVVVWVDFFVVATTEAMVNKIAHRYAEAIVAVLQGERHVEGYRQTDYEPEVVLSEASRHAKTANADLFNDAHVDFIQAGRVVVNFEGA